MTDDRQTLTKLQQNDVTSTRQLQTINETTTTETRRQHDNKNCRDCSENADCFGGEKKCVCKAGFRGDGVTCTGMLFRTLIVLLFTFCSLFCSIYVRVETFQSEEWITWKNYLHLIWKIKKNQQQQSAKSTENQNKSTKSKKSVIIQQKNHVQTEFFEWFTTRFRGGIRMFDVLLRLLWPSEGTFSTFSCLPLWRTEAIDVKCVYSYTLTVNTSFYFLPRLCRGNLHLLNSTSSFKNDIIIYINYYIRSSYKLFDIYYWLRPPRLAHCLSSERSPPRLDNWPKAVTCDLAHASNGVPVHVCNHWITTFMIFFASWIRIGW